MDKTSSLGQSKSSPSFENLLLSATRDKFYILLVITNTTRDIFQY